MSDEIIGVNPETARSATTGKTFHPIYVGKYKTLTHSFVKVKSVAGSPTSYSVTERIENYDPETGLSETILTHTAQTATTGEIKNALDTGKTLSNWIRVKMVISFVGGTAPTLKFAHTMHLKEN